jgi:DNA polymerase III epsilon subunit-like protein
MIQKTLAFIDVETTGTKVLKHEVIEIGLIIVKEEEGKYIIKEELEMKVKPEYIEQAEPGALRVNGYNEGAWMFAHTKKEAAQVLADKTAGAVLVAHNAAFDYSFVEKLFEEADIKREFLNGLLNELKEKSREIDCAESLVLFKSLNRMMHYYRSYYNHAAKRLKQIEEA